MNWAKCSKRLFPKECEEANNLKRINSPLYFSRDMVVFVFTNMKCMPPVAIFSEITSDIRETIWQAAICGVQALLANIVPSDQFLLGEKRTLKRLKMNLFINTQWEQTCAAHQISILIYFIVLLTMYIVTNKDVNYFSSAQCLVTLCWADLNL